jgi:hypothetical protein
MRADPPANVSADPGDKEITTSLCCSETFRADLTVWSVYTAGLSVEDAPSFERYHRMGGRMKSDSGMKRRVGRDRCEEDEEDEELANVRVEIEVDVEIEPARLQAWQTLGRLSDAASDVTGSLIDIVAT